MTWLRLTSLAIFFYPYHLCSSCTELFLKCLWVIYNPWSHWAFTQAVTSACLAYYLSLPSTRYQFNIFLQISAQSWKLPEAFPESLGSLASPPSSIPSTLNSQETCTALLWQLSQLSFAHFCDSIFHTTCILYESMNHISSCLVHYSQCLVELLVRKEPKYLLMNKESKTKQFTFRKYLTSLIVIFSYERYCQVAMAT